MRAAVSERYGDPAKVVRVVDLEQPAPADGEVLVRVRAAGLNIADWYGVTGRPLLARPTTGLRRPREMRLGVDYAGIVEAVGSGVADFAPGDEVFGGRTGALAEYVVAKVDRAIVKKPASVTFEDAAATPVAAITALQALRDKGGVASGESVLIHGASGGVGTYAVQIAKALGGSVTAVCSTPNVELARSLGADRVLDYTVEDVTAGGDRYDVLIDIAGTVPFRRLRRVLTRDARVVIVGGPRKNRLLGPLGHVVGTKLAALLASQHATFFIARLDKPAMEAIRDLLASGQLTSAIDSTYPLERVAEALEHQGSGHPRGKIVVTV